MIEITLEQLINSSDGLKALSEKKLKAKTAFAIGKMLKAADSEIDTFNHTRMDLIRKYGEKDENNELKTDEKGNVRVLSDSVADFNTELKELLNTKVELNANKIKIDDLGEIDFTPVEITQLEAFIEFDEE